MPSPERVLVACITGGRRLLTQRPSVALLDQLADAGYDTTWFVREDQVDVYEQGRHPITSYSLDWANEYSRTHWRHPKAEWIENGFHGAFTGREAAMVYAAEHGYDAVLQLDDNIIKVGPLHANRFFKARILEIPQIADLLTELAFSTTAQTIGGQLNSVQAPKKVRIIRPGFPYSLFIEKVAGRMPYYGPFEDDVMHSLEYALHGGPGRTAAVVDAFRYVKESASKTGMRTHYNTERGLELARRYPNNARLIVGARTSSPNEKARGIRHHLNTRGFTPVRITDPERYQVTQDRIIRVIEITKQAFIDRDRVKILHRAHGTGPLPPVTEYIPT